VRTSGDPVIPLRLAGKGEIWAAYVDMGPGEAVYGCTKKRARHIITVAWCSKVLKHRPMSLTKGLTSFHHPALAFHNQG